MKRYYQWQCMAPLLGVLLLAGCDSDGNDGEDGAPGQVGVSLSGASGLDLAINGVTIDAGKVMVDFSLANSNGVAITDLDTYAGVDTLGMGIAKLVPQSGNAYKTPQWVNYINQVIDPVTANIPAGYETKAGPQIQPGLESSCRQTCLTNNGDGSYTYTFQQNIGSVTPISGLDLAYDANLTHRVTLELRIDGSADKLINRHYDFIPATGAEATPDETRIVENLENSCLRCHSSDYGNGSAPSLILHGGRRYSPQNCQICHTSYAADPETGSPLDLGYMVHNIHRANYVMVGFRGSLHDFSELTFPADVYDCRVCHQEGADRPVDAANWRHHRALACGSCHVQDSTDPATIRAEMHATYQPTHACSTCHADKGDEGAGHHVTDAIAKDNVRMDYKAMLVPDSVDLSAGILKFAVSFKDASGVAQPSPDTDKRIKFSTIYLGFGNDVDFTAARRQSFSLLSNLPVSGGNGVFNYEVPLNLSVDLAVPSSAFITTQMCVDRDTLTGVECGAGSDEAFNPAVIPGDGVVFNLQGDTGLAARRMVVNEDNCANCHDNKYLAKFDSKIHHNGQRTNFEGGCQVCHSPTFGSRAIQDHRDFKVMIHAHHANARVSSASSPITFPEYIGNCAACHDRGSLSLTGLTQVPATTSVDANGNNVEFSPIAAACISCHGTQDALFAHVRSNGGAASDPRGTYQPGSETCAICHGEGRTAGVDMVHPLRAK